METDCNTILLSIALIIAAFIIPIFISKAPAIQDMNPFLSICYCVFMCIDILLSLLFNEIDTLRISFYLAAFASLVAFATTIFKNGVIPHGMSANSKVISIIIFIIIIIIVGYALWGFERLTDILTALFAIIIGFSTTILNYAKLNSFKQGKMNQINPLVCIASIPMVFSMAILLAYFFLFLEGHGIIVFDMRLSPIAGQINADIEARAILVTLIAVVVSDIVSLYTRKTEKGNK